MAKQRTNKPTQPKPSAGRPQPEAAQLPGWFLNKRLQGALIFLLGFLLYANTWNHDYALDDAIVITDNQFTQEGIQGIPGILKYDTFFGFFKDESKATLVAGGRYRPLSLLTFALEVSVFGQQNPFISHLINSLLYGLTALVLFLLLHQWFPAGEKKLLFSHFIALAGALIFAAHPLHTEAVANIKGRDEILSLLGSLAAVWFSFLAYRRRQPIWSILAGLLFLLALFSKENAITFLAVAPLAFFFFSSAGVRTIVVQWLPYFAAALMFLAVRGSILGWQLGEVSPELMNNPFLKIENNRYVPFTPGEKLATVTFTLGKYLQLLVMPYPLTHDYYPRQIGLMDWSDFPVLLSLLAHILLLAYALWGLRRRDPLSFGIAYYLITLSIVSNILFPVGTTMSERFLYMPSVGFALVAAVLLYRLAQLLDPARRITEFRRLNPALGLTALLVLIFSGITIARNPVWKDNFTLFSTDIQYSPNSAKLRNALGGELVTQSAEEKDERLKQRMLAEAIGHLQAAVKIHPNYKNAYLLLGNAHYYLRRWEEAMQYYDQALSLDPDYAEASENLGITLRDAGRFAGEQQGDIPKAIRYLERAYQLRPKEYETVRLLGVAYGVSGNPGKALDFFKRALDLNPKSADAVYNLGTAYYQVGQPATGAEYHQRALAMDPEVEKRMKGE